MASPADSTEVAEEKSSLGDTATQSDIVVGRHYTLHTKIGAGGMASVYLGWLAGAADFSRVVAIKRMHPQFAFDEGFVARFQDEARLSARLSHPNLVQVFDVVEQNRELLIVMEYVHGVSLGGLAKDASEAGRNLPPEVIAGVLVPALHCLHVVHEATDDEGRPIGIVHRDFSPHNIMVSTEGHSKVLDFGIAKARTHAHVTTNGGFAGKIGYCSPEQLGEGVVDRRTDVFSAGIVLWEMLVGDRLFYEPGINEGEAVKRVLDQPIRPPSSVNRDVPRKLDKIVMHALDRAHDRRFASARELALELEAAVVPASPPAVADCLHRLCVERLAKLDRRLSGARRRMARTRLPLPAAPVVHTEKATVRQQPEKPAEPSPPPTHAQIGPVAEGSWPRLLALGVAIVVVGAGLLLWARLFHASAPMSTITKQPEISATRHAPEIAPVPHPAAPLPNPPQASRARAVVDEPPNHQPKKTRARKSELRARPRIIATKAPARQSVAPAPARPNCDPPTYLDADGIRVFKDECL